MDILTISRKQMGIIDGLIISNINDQMKKTFTPIM